MYYGTDTSIAGKEREKPGRDLRRKRNGRFVFLLAAGLLLLLLCGCGAGKSKRDEREVYTRLDQLENKRIGVTTGSVQAIQAEKRFLRNSARVRGISAVPERKRPCEQTDGKIRLAG